MALFEWSDQFSVKVKAMDDQHKVLVGMINDLYRALLSTKTPDVKAKIVESLLKYTIFHFDSEEKMLVEHNYPLLKIQQSEHLAFVKKVEEYNQKLKDGTLELNMEIVKFLTNWLKEHIMGNDQEYGPFMNERGVF
ncbi:MAG: hemerythrin family protein [bacterium]|nr:hemerythrin family protein [bacterium]